MRIDQLFVFIFLSIVKSQNWLVQRLETTAQLIVLASMMNLQIDLALINELIQHCMNNLRIKMDVLILVQRLQISSHLCVAGDVKIDPRQGLG